MKVVGIIAEYNPLHAGHLYHMEKAMELTCADYVIVVMSGCFVQRGSPAIADKFTRANMALQAGADLVLELPVLYATASAELFAYGAISLLDKLNIVDTLVFGSESDKTESMRRAAQILVKEPKKYKHILKESLAKGVTFPAARAAAFANYTNCKEDKDLLLHPNQILGIEYCKAIQKRNSPIRPIAIKRLGNAYHDERLTSEFCSATALRNQIAKTGFTNQLTGYIPGSGMECLNKVHGFSFPIYENDFSLLLRHSLLLCKNQDYSCFHDVSKQLSNRINKHLNQFLSYSQFVHLLKTKELTYTRINRGLLHILLDLKTTDIERARKSDTITYARILGFRKNSQKLLREISEHADIPLITKMAGIESSLSAEAAHMLQKDVFAANLYHSVAAWKFQQKQFNEYNHPLVIL